MPPKPPIRISGIVQLFALSSLYSLFASSKPKIAKAE